MLLYKPWLQVAVPQQAHGHDHRLLGQGDVVHLHVRLAGLTVVIIFAYFQDSIGLTGANLAKITHIKSLTDGGRTKVILGLPWLRYPCAHRRHEDMPH